MIPSIREALYNWLNGSPPDDDEAFIAWALLAARLGAFDAWADSIAQQP